jgi:hypothetical protein
MSVDPLVVSCFDQYQAADDEILDLMVAQFGSAPQFQGSMNFLKLANCLRAQMFAHAGEELEAVACELLALAVRRLASA